MTLKYKTLDFIHSHPLTDASLIHIGNGNEQRWERQVTRQHGVGEEEWNGGVDGHGTGLLAGVR